MIRGGSFSLLSGVRLKNFFLYLFCTVTFMVMFLVAVINSHCQNIYILEQNRFFLFPGRDRILDPIWKFLVIKRHSI